MRRTTIDEAIARVDDWKGREISYKPVSGGITNPNFKVDVEGEHFFLKIIIQIGRAFLPQDTGSRHGLHKP